MQDDQAGNSDGTGAARRTGRIARIVTDRETGLRKGYGFIADEANGQYFFHAADFARGSQQFNEAQEGQRVSFLPTETPKGARAAHIEAER